MGKAKVYSSKNAKHRVEVRSFSRKKLRLTLSRRKKAQISPVLIRRQKRGISIESVISSSDCYLVVDDNISCGSSRVDKSSYSRKRRIEELEEVSGPRRDVKNTIGDRIFRRITRSYSKLEKDKEMGREREREALELCKLSCVDLDSGGDLRSINLTVGEDAKEIVSNENDELSFTRSDVTFVERFSVASRGDCCSSSKFGTITGGSLNEATEICKPDNLFGSDFTVESDKQQKPELQILGGASNLSCTELLTNKEVSDYFSPHCEACLQYSDLNSSEYTPSVYFDSGSEFSEKLLCDSTPSHTHSLFLEFKKQFWRSTMSNAKPSFEDEHQEFWPELRSFEDEEVEESCQRLRERERSHAYFWGYGNTYCSWMGQSNLIPHLRLIMVHWIVNECTVMDLQKETLFLAVSLLDRFLNEGSFKSQRCLLMVGIACLALATRIEENQICNSVQRRKFYIQDEKISRNEVVAMEWLLQEVLNFKCISPTIYNFYGNNDSFHLVAAKASPQVENKAKSLAIIALTDHSLLRYWPSTLAATLVILACIHHNHYEAYLRVIEVHVRTKDNNLPECVKSLEWLLGQ